MHSLREFITRGRKEAQIPWCLPTSSEKQFVLTEPLLPQEHKAPYVHPNASHSAGTTQGGRRTVLQMGRHGSCPYIPPEAPEKCTQERAARISTVLHFPLPTQPVTLNVMAFCIFFQTSSLFYNRSQASLRELLGFLDAAWKGRKTSSIAVF